MKPVIVTKELVYEGMNVMRGRNWIYSDQDGGAGSKGTVISTTDNGRDWVKVKWGYGAIFSYRVGDRGNHDLYVYVPNFYDTPSPLGEVRLTSSNAKKGMKCKLRSDATTFAKDLIPKDKELIISETNSMGISFKDQRGQFKFESFDICKDQTVKVVSIDNVSFRYEIPKPVIKEESIYKFRKGDIVYMHSDKHDSWTRYSEVKDNHAYLVEEVEGNNMKLANLINWQAQDRFLSVEEWTRNRMYTQTRLNTIPMLNMKDIQQNVVSIAENSKPNIKQNGNNTDNPDYSGRTIELPSVTISLERGERIEGTRLHC